MLVLAAVAVILEGVVAGHIIVSMAFAGAMLAAARDWRRLRSGLASPEAVAQRLVFFTLLLTFALALPALETVVDHWRQ
jgi:hypothetical protein